MRTDERVDEDRREWTYDNQQGCGRSDTHRAVGVPLPCAAPAKQAFNVVTALALGRRTNLMATV